MGLIGAGKDPNNDINAQSTVANDRTHMFRVQASGIVPRFDIGVSANFQHLSGFPYGPYFRVQLPQGNFPISFESPGSRRLESQSVLDFRISKIFRVGHEERVEVLADIFNVFNESAAERIVTRNFDSFLFELGSAFVDPRRVMLGVKVAF